MSLCGISLNILKARDFCRLIFWPTAGNQPLENNGGLLMKLESMVLEISVAVVVLGALAAVSASAHADDTYNFYFQKSPGGAAAASGANSSAPLSPQDATAAPAGPVQQNKTAIPPAPALETPEFKHWRFGFGPTHVIDGFQYAGDVARWRVGLSLGYDFNKYFGVEGMMAISPNTGENKHLYGQSLFVLPTVGLTVTPIHISLFGRESISIGLQGGAMYLSTNKDPIPYREEIPGVGVSSGTYLTAEVNDPRLYAYLGLDIGFRITDSMNLTLQSKGPFVGSGAYTMAMTGLNVRF